MTVQEQVAELRRLVESARAMPMSASAVVNRGELLALVDDLSAGLDAELAEAREVVASRQDVVGEGRQAAEQLVAEARDQQQRLASETEVLRAASLEAERVVAEARQESEELRREADDYVDRKLADFEVTLQRTLETVRRGRERLAGGRPDPSHSDEVDRIRLPEHLEE